MGWCARTGKRAIEEDPTGDWRAQKLACFDNQHHESSTPLAVKKGSYSWPPPASKCVLRVCSSLLVGGNGRGCGIASLSRCTSKLSDLPWQAHPACVVVVVCYSSSSSSSSCPIRTAPPLLLPFPPCLRPLPPPCLCPTTNPRTFRLSLRHGTRVTIGSGVQYRGWVRARARGWVVRARVRGSGRVRGFKTRHVHKPWQCAPSVSPASITPVL